MVLLCRFSHHVTQFNQQYVFFNNFYRDIVLYSKHMAHAILYHTQLCPTQLPFAAHGYGAMFTLSILDRHYRPNLTLEEAKDLLKKCIAEVCMHNNLLCIYQSNFVHLQFVTI